MPSVKTIATTIAIVVALELVDAAVFPWKAKLSALEARVAELEGKR